MLIGFYRFGFKKFGVVTFKVEDWGGGVKSTWAQLLFCISRQIFFCVNSASRNIVLVPILTLDLGGWMGDRTITIKTKTECMFGIYVPDLPINDFL